MTTNKVCCIIGCTATPIMTCLGCSNLLYCNLHYKEHRENLNKQLEDLTNLCHICQVDIEAQIQSPQSHILMETVNQWEENSIREIKRIAEETRQELLPRIINYIPQVKIKLNYLTEELRKNLENDAFVDTDVKIWYEKLEMLKQILHKPSNFTVQEDITSFLNKIQLKLLDDPEIPLNAQWSQNGVTVVGGHDNNTEGNDLHHPQGIFLDDDETIYITERYSSHIVQSKINNMKKQRLAGDHELGQLKWATNVFVDKATDSLVICDHGNERVIRWSRCNGAQQGEILIDNITCYGVAVDCQGCMYVSDTEKNEVRKYQPFGDKTGTIVAGGNGSGDGLHQLNYPTYVFVDRQQAVYVSDRDNHRVMKWTKNAAEGTIVAGNGMEGTTLSQLCNPNGLFVDQLGSIYIVDTGNDRVMRWLQGATQGTIVVGGHDQGAAANQFSSPEGLCFDRLGNLYVVDKYNNRVQRFSIR